MSKFNARFLAVLPACLVIAGAAHADGEGMTLGAFEYNNSCATCHGTSGKGDGSIAGYLNTALPDLTQLSKNNGGVFPVSQVYGFIAGTDAVGPHGTRDMPAWGMRYQYRAEGDEDFASGDAAAFANTRILALIDHLAGMQEN